MAMKNKYWSVTVNNETIIILVLLIVTGMNAIAQSTIVVKNENIFKPANFALEISADIKYDRPIYEILEEADSFQKADSLQKIEEKQEKKQHDKKDKKRKRIPCFDPGFESLLKQILERDGILTEESFRSIYLILKEFNSC